MPTAVAAPFRFFDLQVTRTRRLSPSLRPVTFGGAGTRRLRRRRPGPEPLAVPAAPGPADPSRARWRRRPGARPGDGTPGGRPGRHALVHGPRAAPDAPAARPKSTSTSRCTARTGAAPRGPGLPLGRGAEPGDRLDPLGPAVADNTAVRFRPPAGHRPVLIWADETALPAASAILEWLPAGRGPGSGWRSRARRGPPGARITAARRRDQLARPGRGQRPRRRGRRARRPGTARRAAQAPTPGSRASRQREGAAPPSRAGARVSTAGDHVRRLLAAWTERGAAARGGEPREKCGTTGASSRDRRGCVTAGRARRTRVSEVRLGLPNFRRALAPLLLPRPAISPPPRRTPPCARTCSMTRPRSATAAP